MYLVSFLDFQPLVFLGSILPLFMSVEKSWGLSNSLQLNKNYACAAGIDDLIPGLPSGKFPDKVPSGVNVCDETCNNSSICTYNWQESLHAFPFLLFRCQCLLSQCPPTSVLFGGYMEITCENVTGNENDINKSRCHTCAAGQRAFKCTFDVFPSKNGNNYGNNYYCVCC